MEQLQKVIISIKTSVAGAFKGLIPEVVPGAFGHVVDEDLFSQEKLAAIANKYSNVLKNPLTYGITNEMAVDLNKKLDGIYERLGRIKMVTDTGALVGEIIDEVDMALGEKQLLESRGV